MNACLQRLTIRLAVAALIGRAEVGARADTVAPSSRAPRGRPCCALAADMRVDVGRAHAPVVIGGVIGPRGLGRHSYSPLGAHAENNATVYTRRGGFIDLAHTRDNADIAAYLALRLRPLLAAGTGEIDLDPKGGRRRIVVTRAVRPEDVDEVSDRAAIRITFELSVWTELVQYYGLTKFQGADESYSAFTPDDPYSNLLGAHLGVLALESDLPYDHAMDVALSAALERLGAVSKSETRAIFQEVEGRWWNPDYAWPSPQIAVARSFGIGPLLAPKLVPASVLPPESPAVIDVPEVDGRGAPLADDYRLEIAPDRSSMRRYPDAERSTRIGEEDLPRLVDDVRRALAEDAVAEKRDGTATAEIDPRGFVAHYVSGLRLFELSGAGGIATAADGAEVGVGGGDLTLLRGDTRAGDLRLMKLSMLSAPQRGLVNSLAFFQSEALWFCHDPDDGSLRAPLVSMLGPCAPGEWLGLSASLGEVLHDGGTGRTAIRPIHLALVVNPLGNGQSASYEVTRVLLQLGGEVEHVWTESEGARTLPRATSGVDFLVRDPSLRFEGRAAAGYRIDPAQTHDVVFESDLAVGYNFVLGGADAPGVRPRNDPWAIAQVGVEGCYSYWTRPQNAFPETVAPFVSAERPNGVQVIVTGSFGIERLTF